MVQRRPLIKDYHKCGGTDHEGSRKTVLCPWTSNGRSCYITQSRGAREEIVSSELHRSGRHREEVALEEGHIYFKR